MSRRPRLVTINEYWREQSRKRRQRCRESGDCIVCMTRAAREGRVTCQRCCEAATRATAQRRRNARLRADCDAVIATLDARAVQ